MPPSTSNDLEIALDYHKVFSSPEGKRVLEHLCECFHVTEAMEPEERMTEALAYHKKHSKDTLDPVQVIQIDPTLVQIRYGRKSVYWHIVKYTSLGEEKMKKGTKDAGRGSSQSS